MLFDLKYMVNICNTEESVSQKCLAFLPKDFGGRKQVQDSLSSGNDSLLLIIRLHLEFTALNWFERKR
jgi:hypothetical protein